MGRLAALAAVAVTLAAGGGDAYLIQGTAHSLRVGTHALPWTATYATLLRALGPSSSCRLGTSRFGVDPERAVAVWKKLGVRVELQTYGGLRQGKDGCTAPGQIEVHTIRLSGGAWHTPLGLRVADSVDRLRRLYPGARRTAGVREWYGRGYWLTKRWVGGYEGVGGAKPWAPVLVAETKAGRVASFLLVVDGEGD